MVSGLAPTVSPTIAISPTTDRCPARTAARTNVSTTAAPAFTNPTPIVGNSVVGGAAMSEMPRKGKLVITK